MKEEDADTVEHLPDRLASQHPNLVMEKGMAEIEAAVAEARAAHAAAQASSDRASMAAAALEIRYWSAACERATRSRFERHFRSPVRRYGHHRSR